MKSFHCIKDDSEIATILENTINLNQENCENYTLYNPLKLVFYLKQFSYFEKSIANLNHICNYSD